MTPGESWDPFAWFHHHLLMLGRDASWSELLRLKDNSPDKLLRNCPFEWIISP